ncbi:MAG: DUF971 domain-containing protein [Verrucomicrobia bacterium]|nr:DUF971 domain-containing protein [Verrucomicrobiota bacterium]
MLAVPLVLKTYEMIGNELALRWQDGSESYVSLRDLRLACPCALCAGERDLFGREYRHRQELTEKSFVLKKCQLVGGYALQPTWGDGHNTGIYSFAYLKSLGAPEP